jgi:hypothetical protein
VYSTIKEFSGEGDRFQEKYQEWKKDIKEKFRLDAHEFGSTAHKLA